MLAAEPVRRRSWRERIWGVPKSHSMLPLMNMSLETGGRVPRGLWWTALAVLFGVSIGQPAGAQEPPTQARTISVQAGEPATLTVWNRPIVTLRATIDNRPPRVRIAEIAERIEDIPVTIIPEVTAVQATQGGLSGYWISASGRPILALIPEDLDPETGGSLGQVAQQTAKRLTAALEARSQQRRLPLLIRSIALTIAATGLFALMIWVISLLRTRALRRLSASTHRRPLEVRGTNLRPYLRIIEQGTIRATALGCALIAAYLWLTFVLLQFPYTEPWGDGLGAWIRGLVVQLGDGALHAVPGFVTVIIIFLLTRLITQAVGRFLRRVEAGWLRVTWLEADTARATRRIAVVLIWIFAFTVAYPYIPGSDSNAFKGVSVLLGLMISLGSAGFVNQVMSGFVIVYSRSMKTGEYVTMGSVDGTITEVGVLSTKMVTPTRQEITIPNAVLVGSEVTNHSRLNDRAHGSIVTTTVTLGYDTPWRQVHAMLTRAAERTEAVRTQPKPVVLQRALSDFYVEYQLLVSIDRPEMRRRVLSELHGHIQDVFNEFGVQIMSPHFVAQPEQPVTVPAEAWHAPPAEPRAEATAEPPAELKPSNPVLAGDARR